MSISAGTRLGPYEIVSRVGAGGMGEVFRARDTRLDRTVAVKTLTAEMAGNAQLRARFQREAKAISALSHPNICALYDVGEHDGVDYLVMEFLEGETLADRLMRGALPVKETLRIAIDIAAALERAHREGIVHRDLKPGNVMLTRGGAKLLDFGLAKAGALQGSISAEAPTVQHADAPLTSEGMIVGTFQYMAPEQIEGSEVDARTDIFAFGVLLYEMLTGRRAFSGRTKTSLIASIVAGTPTPIADVQPVTPPQLEHVVQRCMEKEPDQRWQSAHDIRLELEWIARHGDAPDGKKLRRLPLWTLGAAAALLLGLLSFLLWKQLRQAPATSLRTHILAPRGKTFVGLMETMTLSPDGMHVTFTVASDERLWVRRVDSSEARPIEGTEGVQFPFWSHDSRWIAFFADDKLKKVNLSGAPPVTLCPAPRGRSGTWSEDDVILFSPSATTGIYRVAAGGGTAAPLTKLDASQKETTHRWPLFLPDGKQFIYFAGTHQESVGSESNALYVSSLDDPQNRRLLLRVRSNAIYARGHLLYVKDQVLVAQPFDAGSGTLKGEPFRVADGIEYDADFFRGTFAAAESGALIYRTMTSPPNAQLTWFDDGKKGDAIGAPLPYRAIRLSRDARRLAASVVDRTTGLSDLWLLELEGDHALTRITATKEDGEGSPSWSRDGKRIAFTRSQGFASECELIELTVDGNAERVLLKSSEEVLPTDWSPDGRFILYDLVPDPGPDERQGDIMIMSTEGAGTPRPLIAGPSYEFAGTFSPDGTWVVYVSAEGGTPQAYATRFPDGGARVQITSHPTFQTLWLDEGIIVRDAEGLSFVPVTISGGALRRGPLRRVKPFDASIITGDIASPRRSLLGVRTSDAWDESILLATDWIGR